MAGNIAELFARHRATPRAVLYRHATDDGWRDVTVAELETDVARWQAAFRREGLVAGDRIALAARNGPSWVAIDLAALGLALVVVPLYVDDNPDNLAWCVANAEAKLAIVENVAALRGSAQGRPGGHASAPHRRAPRGGSHCERRRRGGRRRIPGGSDRSGRGRAVARTDARDHLLHVGDRGPAQRRDAVAWQHPRQRRGLPRDGDGAPVRSLSVDPAALAHVRAHRRLLLAAVHRCDGRVCARCGPARRRLPAAGADRRLRRAAHLRTLRRAHRALARGFSA